MNENKIFEELNSGDKFLILSGNGDISNNYVYMKIPMYHSSDNCVRLYDGVLFIIKDDQKIIKVLV